MPGLTMFVMFLCQLLFPIAMSPVFLAPLAEMFWQRAALPTFVPINLILSALFCGAMLLFYRWALTPLGNLLHQRETKILGVVTVEVE